MWYDFRMNASLPIFGLVLLASLPLRAADEVAAGPSGTLRWTAESDLCSLSPMLADRSWKFAGNTPDNSPAQPFGFTLAIGDRKVRGSLQASAVSDNAAEATWTFTAESDFEFGELALSDDFGVGALAGGSWAIGERTGTFPATYRDVTVVSANGSSVTLTPPAGTPFTLSFSEPLHVLLQDNRKWGGGSFSMRIGKVMSKFEAGKPVTISMRLESPRGIAYSDDLPVHITAGDDWIPLVETSRDIVPDSALDFSAFGFADGPCGKRGRIIVRPDGHFAEAEAPDKPLRFYGVNLCFNAQYLPHEETDRLLDRLVRLGYNALRIHHYECELTNPAWRPGFDWSADKVDRLDYLIAGCAKRGLWLTTDLYVSRPVPGKQIGFKDDKFDAERFKQLVLVYEPAFQDFLAFTKQLLDHQNPYTGRRLAEEPALAWISLVNEGGIGMGGFSPDKYPEWKPRWNAWLAKNWPDRDALDTALGDLRDAEDPAAGNVEFPANHRDGSRRARLCQLFLAEVERDFFLRVKAYLRDELGCEALLTDINCAGPRVPAMHLARAEFDYVDEHFYVDHPMYGNNGNNPPSTCRNSNPVRDGALGGADRASVRVWGKPLTISEFNYAAPGRYRGQGGLITGAMAALQDWDALWRFSYAHRSERVSQPYRLDYFDLATDPLGQASDRAAAMLFLRGDLAPHTTRLAADFSKDYLRTAPSRVGFAGMEPLVWKAAVGSFVDPAAAPKGAIRITARESQDAAAARAALDGKAAPEAIRLDQKAGTFSMSGERMAGGCLDAGATLEIPGACTIAAQDAAATIVLASLDSKPLADSARILVTHLTDLQDEGADFGETARRTLKAWGKLPHLVLRGRATVALTHKDAKALHVWALATDGTRVAEIPAEVRGGVLRFPLDVRGPDGNACLYYEVARE